VINGDHASTAQAIAHKVGSSVLSRSRPSRGSRADPRSAVAPGKGGLATFAPPLDKAGNSVRGQLAARFLSRALGLDIFMSRAGDRATEA
jgi:glutaminase